MRRRARPRERVHSLAERLADRERGPQLVDERLADHRDERRRHVVLAAKISAGQQANAHRREIVAARQSQIGLSRFTTSDDRRRRLTSGQRNDRHQRGRLDARNSRRLVAQRRIAARDELGRRVARLGQKQPSGENAARLESRIDALHQPRAAKQQPRCDEQRDRQRHLGDDEDSAKSIARAAALSSTFAQRRLEVRAGRAKRWEQTEQDAAHHAHHQREREHVPIDARLLETRNVFRADGENHAQQSICNP